MYLIVSQSDVVFEDYVRLLQANPFRASACVRSHQTLQVTHCVGGETLHTHLLTETVVAYDFHHPFHLLEV